MNINQDDSAKGRGIRTSLQALIGIFTGLFLAVWRVDGVPEVVWGYVTNNLSGALLLIGLPAGVTGVVSYIWNRQSRHLPN